MCKGNVDMGTLPASEHPLLPMLVHTHPGPPFFTALSPFLLLVGGGRGLWQLIQALRQMASGKYVAQSRALGGRRGQGV